MDKQKIQPIVSTWLITEDDSLKEIMSNLAKNHQAPKLIPHITMFSVNVSSDRVEEMRNKVMKIAQDLQPITLKVKDIGYEDTLFTSLFIRFEESEDLKRLQDRVKERLSRFGDYKFKPHTSILYKVIPEEEKIKIVPGLKSKLPKTITFTKLGVIVHENPEAQKDIENWEVWE